jgi:hypothetical protein
LLPAIRVEGRRAQGPGTHLADSFARPRTPSDLRTTSSV